MTFSGPLCWFENVFYSRSKIKIEAVRSIVRVDQLPGCHIFLLPLNKNNEYTLAIRVDRRIAELS